MQTVLDFERKNELKYIYMVYKFNIFVFCIISVYTINSRINASFSNLRIVSNKKFDLVCIKEVKIKNSLYFSK